MCASILHRPRNTNQSAAVAEVCLSSAEKEVSGIITSSGDCTDPPQPLKRAADD